MNGILVISKKKTTVFSRKKAVGILLWTGSLFVALCFSGELADGVREGLRLCGNVILPSLFPFLILSDLLCAYGQDVFPGWAQSAFSHVFGIRGSGITAFLAGSIGGFPLGAKTACSLYRNGEITREEAERLLGFSNNTGPAFLVAGIGIGLFGSRAVGTALWLSVILSAILTGILFRKPCKAENPRGSVKEKTFSFVDSVRDSGIRSIGICAFILFFSAVTHAIRILLFRGRTSALSCLLFSFLEVGSAVREIQRFSALSLPQAMCLLGFAVGFSGLSVHLQALSFCREASLSGKRYVVMKTVQGVLCAFLSFLFGSLLR